jgi:sensor histidine kinase regulating citrate/malate metabolism
MQKRRSGISVQDNGIGIDQRNISKFSRYSRSSPEINTKEQGVGLSHLWKMVTQAVDDYKLEEVYSISISCCWYFMPYVNSVLLVDDERQTLTEELSKSGI